MQLIAEMGLHRVEIGLNVVFDKIPTNMFTRVWLNTSMITDRIGRLKILSIIQNYEEIWKTK